MNAAGVVVELEMTGHVTLFLVVHTRQFQFPLGTVMSGTK